MFKPGDRVIRTGGYDTGYVIKYETYTVEKCSTKGIKLIGIPGDYDLINFDFADGYAPAPTNNNMTMFKPGDRVIRTGSSSGRVIKGDTYEVVRVDNGKIYLKGFLNDYYIADKFKLAPKEEIITPVYGRYYIANCESPAGLSCKEVYIIQFNRMHGNHYESLNWRQIICSNWNTEQGNFTTLVREITEYEAAQLGHQNPCREIHLDKLPERWYIETKKGPDRDFVADFYRSILNTSCYYDFYEISSHNEGGASIFESTAKTGKSFGGARGTKITIEQFKQLINNHQNKNNNGTINNNEVQRHAEPIGNTSSGRGITTPSRKCTIATTNGYVGNTFRDKPSKATVVQSVLNANVLVSSHN